MSLFPRCCPLVLVTGRGAADARGQKEINFLPCTTLPFDCVADCRSKKRATKHHRYYLGTLRESEYVFQGIELDGSTFRGCKNRAEDFLTSRLAIQSPGG
jgi:hypothetical protein